MSLTLFIDGKLRYEMPICFIKNAFTNRCLLFNGVEKIKLMYMKEIRDAEEWQIFIIQKSKL